MAEGAETGPYRVVAPRHEPVAERESSVPARDAPLRRDADVVVVGGGCAGLCSALFAAWLGDDVVLLEKAPELGGTTAKSSFWIWVPNNGPMRDAGLEDRERDFLEYCARTARPERFVADHPSFGPTSGTSRCSARSTRAPGPPSSC